MNLKKDLVVSFFTQIIFSVKALFKKYAQVCIFF